ncbi:MAG: phosphohistidine phosphatase SixA [Candidatus Kapaibacteriales bacterium]
MKTILINRHAKSDWASGAETDFDRPLNERGKRDAPVMANRLKDRNIDIDKMISSPANRAISTCRVFAEKLECLFDQIQIEMAIYENGTNALKKLLPELESEVSTVLLFGHNPHFSSIITYYTGEQFGNLPTCGIVCIDFPIDSWEEINNVNGTIRFFDYPKNDI